MTQSAEALQAELDRLRAENDELKALLRAGTSNASTPQQHTSSGLPRTQLSNAEIARFSRQLLMPEIGVQGQLNLLNSSVLVVGAGGLGAPVIMYLAAAGIGRLGIVDYDAVEASNLQRQIIHDETKVGVPKAESAKMTVEKLTSFCECTTHNVVFDSSNALPIIQKYDIVVDATDNVATRYLLNDACILSGKVLVSGSALRMDGQLTVYNYQGGPCYRCIFPKPPPPETVTNCSDGGVLGVVFGTFRQIKLRGRNTECAVCGDNPSIKELIDYVQFCGAAATDKTPSQRILTAEERVSCQSYYDLVEANEPHVLLDVRETVQYNICALPGSIHIPWKDLEKRIDEVQVAASNTKITDSPLSNTAESHLPVYVVCRLGNDSQLAVQLLKQRGLKDVKDIVGGLERWARDVDPTFPTY
ncbi:hypothetical protein HDV00_008004 [Rhizophlyctis rosea]|nr:hypothetical protein HDV00_008004 [Rhizophlyctis rosea]